MALSNILLKNAKEELDAATARFNEARSNEEIDAAIHELNKAEKKFNNLFKELRGKEVLQSEKENIA